MSNIYFHPSYTQPVTTSHYNPELRTHLNNLIVWKNVPLSVRYTALYHLLHKYPTEALCQEKESYLQSIISTKRLTLLTDVASYCQSQTSLVLFQLNFKNTFLIIEAFQ